MKNILLRFDKEDELNELIEKTALKIGFSKSALAKISLHKFCKDLEEKENAKSTD